MDFLSDPIFQVPLGLIAIYVTWRVFKRQTQKGLLSIDKQNQNELAVNKNTLIVTGLVAGVIGAALGFLPFGIFHQWLAGFLPTDVSVILFILAFGYPLPLLATLVVLPLGGAIMGVVGTNIGLKIYLKKNIGNDHLWRVAFFWGLIFGFLINIFFGFYSQ